MAERVAQDPATSGQRYDKQEQQVSTVGAVKDCVVGGFKQAVGTLVGSEALKESAQQQQMVGREEAAAITKKFPY